MRLSSPRGRRLFGLSGVIALMCAGGAGAADREPSSRESITITASVAARSDVSGLSDMALTDDSMTAPLAQSACIWINTATHGFAVTAQGGGPKAGFSVGDGRGRSIPYDVAWNGAKLRAGSALTGLVAKAARPDCRGASAGAATLEVALAAPATHYLGSLSLLIVPE